MLRWIGARPISTSRLGVGVMQISRPRDLGPLVLVIGLFLILLIVTLMVGVPQR
jgi:hypothetical protein